MKRMLFIALAVCSIEMLATSCTCSNNQEKAAELASKVEDLDAEQLAEEAAEKAEEAADLLKSLF